MLLLELSVEWSMKNEEWGIKRTWEMKMSNDVVLGSFVSPLNSSYEGGKKSAPCNFLKPKRHPKKFFTLSKFDECSFYHSKLSILCYELVSKTKLGYGLAKLSILQEKFLAR